MTRSDLVMVERELDQPSIATKQETCPESAPRTETAIASAICKSGKFETGEGTCAFVCMDRMGDVRKSGCSHAAHVHAKLAATIAAEVRAQCGYDHGYADGVEWATKQYEPQLTKTPSADHDDGNLRGGGE